MKRIGDVLGIATIVGLIGMVMNINIDVDIPRFKVDVKSVVVISAVVFAVFYVDWIVIREMARDISVFG